MGAQATSATAGPCWGLKKHGSDLLGGSSPGGEGVAARQVEERLHQRVLQGQHVLDGLRLAERGAPGAVEHVGLLPLAGRGTVGAGFLVEPRAQDLEVLAGELGPPAELEVVALLPERLPGHGSW